MKSWYSFVGTQGTHQASRLPFGIFLNMEEFISATAWSSRAEVFTGARHERYDLDSSGGPFLSSALSKFGIQVPNCVPRGSGLGPP